MSKDLSWGSKGSVDLDVSSKDAVFELHASGLTLSILHVGSCKSLDLVLLKRAVLVVEAFGGGLSCGCQIVEGLELPVSPTSKDSVGVFSHLSNFSDTRVYISACSKFTHQEWNLEVLGILAHSHEFVFDEIVAECFPEANFQSVGAWLVADGGQWTTAVCMLVHDVMG